MNVQSVTSYKQNQNPTPNFQGVFKISARQETGTSIKKVLDIGFRWIYPDTTYITCADKKDSLMRKILKEFGIKFQHRKFRSDFYTSGTLPQYFVKKNK